MSLSFPGPVPVPKPQTAALTVLITGASRGLGFELVRQYAEARTDNLVFAAVRNPSSQQSKAVVAFAAQHSNVRVLALDVASSDSIKASVAEVRKASPHLDLLVNNAGETSGKDGCSALTVTAAEFDAIFHTNATGTLLVTQAYVPLLRGSTVEGGAKVVNVSSALGSSKYATLFGPTISYGASKAAINYLTVVLAHEISDVTFLAIHPGLVQTDMAGSNAPTPVNDSVQAIRYYTAEKGLKDSGLFLDIPTGKPIPH